MSCNWGYVQLSYTSSSPSRGLVGRLPHARRLRHGSHWQEQERPNPAAIQKLAMREGTALPGRRVRESARLLQAERRAWGSRDEWPRRPCKLLGEETLIHRRGPEASIGSPPKTRARRCSNSCLVA